MLFSFKFHRLCTLLKRWTVVSFQMIDLSRLKGRTKARGLYTVTEKKSFRSVVYRVIQNR